MSLKDRLDPLAWNVPIVNKDGTPTPEFMRKWTAQRSINGSAIDLSILPKHVVLLGETAYQPGYVPAGTNGQLLIGQTNLDPAFKSITGDLTMLATGAGTVTGIQGHPVSSVAPVDGEILRWTAADGKYDLKAEFAGYLISGADTYTAMGLSLSDPEVVLAGGLPVYTKNGMMANLVKGVTDGSDAAAGMVGELMDSFIPQGSAINLTTAVAVNVTSLNLTAGDWDVFGIVAYFGGATTIVTEAAASVSTTSATLATDGTLGRAFLIPASASYTPFSTNDIMQQCGPVRVSVSATTTVYLVGRLKFTTSTATAYGELRARRVR